MASRSSVPTWPFFLGVCFVFGEFLTSSVILCFVIIAGVVDSIAAFQAVDQALVPANTAVCNGADISPYINRVFV